MKKLFFILVLAFIGCESGQKEDQRMPFSRVEVESVLEDTISIRAVEIMGNSVAFAGSGGAYGLYTGGKQPVKVNRQQHDSIVPEFRAVASTENDFFMLSVATPALLYKTGDDGQMELVYKEEGETVFYDSMVFWNDREGIAMGDPVEDCLSVIITRNGGESWKKLSCDQLPETAEGEAAFAASDSNIAVVGEQTWMISGGMASRIFYSPDKGESWEVFELPLIQGEPTTGAYTLDFFDEDIGIVFGGDYTSPEKNTANKAVTTDGGKNWRLISEGKGPGYQSSVRFVPGGKGSEIIAAGPSGISYSQDRGQTWDKLSDQGLHTIRFVNDSVAFAGGSNGLFRLNFK